MRHVVALVISLSMVAGLIAPTSAHAAEKIKITVPAASVTLASLYYAKAAGYFAAEGLNVRIVTVPGGGALRALVAGDAQVSVTPGTYQLQAHEKGQKLTAAGSIFTRNSVNIVMHKLVARQKGIGEKSPLMDKVKALKGLKLAAAAVGSFSHQVMLHHLLEAGIDPRNDVRLTAIGDGRAMVRALQQRKIDAFAAEIPFPDVAVYRGLGLMIVDNAAGEDPDSGEFMMNSIIVHPDYAAAHPETVGKVVRALIRANRWLVQNRPEVAVVSVRPFLGRLGDEMVLSGLKKMRLGVPLDGRITERANTLTQDFMIRIGALRAPIPYEALVTHEFLPK